MWRVVAVAGLALALLSLAHTVPASLPAIAAGNIVVTSTGDAGGDGLCPHESTCTLRAAIQLANADDTGGAFTITFEPGVFDPNEPATIEVGLAPLPPIARPGAVLDASGAGVRIRNNDPSLSGSSNGLHLAANSITVLGLDIGGFPASCVLVAGQQAVIGGDSSLGRGNRLSDCGTGIAVYGQGATIIGNVLRAQSGVEGSGFSKGVEVAAPAANVGPDLPNLALANVIGDAEVAVTIVGSGATPVSGVLIQHNHIGRSVEGAAAPVGTGVSIQQWSSNTLVRQNAIANAQIGIEVVAGDEGPPPAGNSFIANSFNLIAVQAILLPAGVGPAPASLTRATQSRIEGKACAGCQVQLYSAFHVPGGVGDYGTTPLAGGVVTADGSGAFSLDNPPISPGEWITTLVTGAGGHTGSFGPSARVGAGAVQCGSSQLQAGWNHIAYFGPQVVFLGDTFAPDPAGRITAIYRMVDGTMNYERWFRSGQATQTLTLVEPGESYWMFATDAVTLPGGFSVSFPIPVELAAGWNDFVYVGATSDVPDALNSVSGKYRDLHRFDTGTGRFLRYGDPSIPRWAQEFSVLTACSTYQVYMLEPATLTPLQP
jgi:CSLREA domain-containing protein